MRGYYDVIPARESAPDPWNRIARTPGGDPLPRIDFVDDPVSAELRGYTEAKIEERFRRILTAGGGAMLNITFASDYDHPGGGCRMGDDPDDSVVDAWGRAHDHENLWIAGAPTIVGSGCNNGHPDIRRALAPHRFPARRRTLRRPREAPGTVNVRRLAHLSVPAVWFLAACGSEPQAPPGSTHDAMLVLTADRVVDGRGGILEGHGVVVREGPDRGSPAGSRAARRG